MGIMKHGQYVTVMAPEPLRQVVAETLRGALGSYSK